MSTSIDYRVTNNEGWGFYGAFTTLVDEAFAKEAWSAAFELVQHSTNWDDKAVRDFLDSRAGRHYADSIAWVDLTDMDAVRDAMLEELPEFLEWYNRG